MLLHISQKHKQTWALLYVIWAPLNLFLERDETLWFPLATSDLWVAAFRSETRREPFYTKGNWRAISIHLL